jgi:hypothetical protein
MNAENSNGGMSVIRRILIVTAPLIVIAVVAMCWWFSRHTVIRITNDADGDLLNVVVVSRNGVQITVKETTTLTVGQSHWMTLPCAGHCSYLLDVQFVDGRAFKTEERYAEAWGIAVEKVGAKNSVYE